MRNVMRTLTGLLALLVGATTATAAVGSAVDSSGAVATEPASAAYDAGANATADASGVQADADGSAEASLVLPPTPDVEGAFAQAEAKADETQATAATTVSRLEGESSATGIAAANAGAEMGANGSAAAGGVAADANASAEATVEATPSLLDWLRMKIDLVVTAVRGALPQPPTTATPDLPPLDASVVGSVDGLVNVDGSSVAGGLDAAGSAVGGEIAGSGDARLLGDVALPTVPALS